MFAYKYIIEIILTNILSADRFPGTNAIMHKLLQKKTTRLRNIAQVFSLFVG